MSIGTSPPVTPAPIVGIYDEPMWEAIRARAMALQHCVECEKFQYPPAPACTHCGADRLDWIALSGAATIISWVVFHKTYLPAYPAPYNVIAVRLREGPVMVSNLEPPTPASSWIGRSVKLVYSTMPDGLVLPRFRLASTEGIQADGDRAQ
jgi:hypothetical protein